MTDVTTDDVVINALEPVEAVVETPVEAEVTEVQAETEVQPELDLGAEEVKPTKEKAPPQAPKWAMERINENQNKADRLAEEKAQAQRELAEAKALLERMQGGDKDQPRTRVEEPDIEALVEARAARKLFDADCDTVANAWQVESPEAFKSRLDILGSVGILPLKDGSNTAFMEDILAVDKPNAHKILDMLAQDPERALTMRNMNSRARIAALTRMQMSETSKPAATLAAPRVGVSKVPPPKPVVDAVSDNLGEMDLTNDKLDDATWSKMWNKKYRKSA